MAESDKSNSNQNLSKNNAILKKALLEEKKNKKEVEDKLLETEAELRSKIEEIEKLNLNNDHLTKRIEALVEQMNGLKKVKGSGIFGVFSSKAKEVNEKLTNDIKILEEELQIKIQENEQLHIRMFELKQEQTQLLEDMEKQLHDYKSNYTNLAVQIKELQEREESLNKRIGELEILVKNLDNEIKTQYIKSAELDTKNQIEKHEISFALIKEQQKYRQKVVFDPEEDDELNIYNSKGLSNATKQSQLKRISEMKLINSKQYKAMNDYINLWLQKYRMIIIALNNNDKTSFPLHLSRIIKNMEAIDTISNEIINVINAVLETEENALHKCIQEPSQSTNIKKIFEFKPLISIDATEKYRGSFFTKIKEFQSILSSIDSLFLTILNGEEEFVSDHKILKLHNDSIAKHWNAVMTSINSTVNLILTFNSMINKTPKRSRILSLKKMFYEIPINFAKCLETIILKLQAENDGIMKSESSSLNAIFFNHFDHPENILKVNCEIIEASKTFSGNLTTFMQTLICNIEDFSRVSLFEALCNNNDINKSVSKNLFMIDENLKLAQIGIPYDIALKNDRNLIELLIKEKKYAEQIESLKIALQNAESQIEGDYGIDKMSNSSEQTALVSDDTRNLLQEIERLSASLQILKQRYEEVCIQANATPNYEGISLDMSTSILDKTKQISNLSSLSKQLPTSMTTTAASSLFNEPLLFGKNYDSEIESASENIEKGLQRLSMKLMNNKLKLIPLNMLTQQDIQNSDKFKIFFEKAKSLLLQLAILNESLEQKNVDINEQCEALREALNSEIKHKEKLEKNNKDLERVNAKLKDDMQTITRNYEAQLKDMTEHFLSLNAKLASKKQIKSNKLLMI